jgi:hypothetical protein
MNTLTFAALPVMFALTPEWRARLTLLGALFAVIVGALLVLALLWRRPHSRRKHHSHQWQSRPERKSRSRHRKRRTAHPERPMNPTLSEAGGLPPARPASEAAPLEEPADRN